jgi:poly-gamma-glutamate synthesis protein (capsule biosynthesis protein)
MRRRGFLVRAGKTVIALAVPGPVRQVIADMQDKTRRAADDSSAITLFLCGDVMTGRGIDQVLPHSCEPTLHEPYVTNALTYVELAEERNGTIPKPVAYTYIWGDALQELTRHKPDVRIINLETAVTTSDAYWRGKGIHYRMHPENVPCLSAAAIDCCVLANNHVLDWGYAGLTETLNTLHDANIKTTGAGTDSAAAEAPAIMALPGKGRVIVYALAHESSGVTADWGATKDRSGVNLLRDFSSATIEHLAAQTGKVKRPGDIVVVSIHWGANYRQKGDGGIKY